jgi:hypothetical protein
MKRFTSVSDIPDNCIMAPTANFAPRHGAKSVGNFEGMRFFRRTDVSELLPEKDWRIRGRKIKTREQPLAHRGCPKPIAVYAEWQTV